MDTVFERLARNDKATQTKDGILLFLKFYCRDFVTGVRVDGVKGSASEAERADMMQQRIKIAKRACTRVASLFADEL